MIPAHWWIHVVRLGFPGIGAAVVYFGKAPLVCQSKLESDILGSRTVEHCYGVLGQTGWTHETALFWAVVAFGAIALVTYVTTGSAFRSEG